MQGTVMSVSCPAGYAWSPAPTGGPHNATCTNVSGSGQWALSDSAVCVGAYNIQRELWHFNMNNIEVIFVKQSCPKKNEARWGEMRRGEMRRGEVRGAEARRVSRAEIYDERPRETSGREREAPRDTWRERERRERATRAEATWRRVCFLYWGTRRAREEAECQVVTRTIDYICFSVLQSTARPQH